MLKDLTDIERYKTPNTLRLDIPMSLRAALDAITERGGRVFAVGGKYMRYAAV